MPIRNPFATLVANKRPANDENFRPDLLTVKDAAHPGFERVDTVGSKASSALSIRSAKDNDNGDYKMSGMLASRSPERFSYRLASLLTRLLHSGE